MEMDSIRIATLREYLKPNVKNVLGYIMKK